MKDAEKIARETVIAWHKASPKVNGEMAALADHIATALRSAYSAGYAAAREQAAGVVTEHYEALSQEHRLLLMNRAIAIRAMEPHNE